MERSQEFRIGTSGWNYKHWKEIFYPANVAQRKWLEFYCTRFDTVELNATFYRLPKVETFQSWKKRTPQGFLWAVKANKFITHTKRLKDCEEPIERFYSSVKGLDKKLGPILFQLPPSLQFDESLFEDFCSLLSNSYKHVLEVRHASWIDDKAFQIMAKNQIAFCISDTAGRYPYHEQITADFTYVRLHGSKKLYASKYATEELETWAKKLLDWGVDAYVYFDNDFGGNAVENAMELKGLLALRPPA
ncbi:MAG: DUF72 domain-containing protein [Deltaproteobacteria bacterium]|nr:DUF72 domain-containing protein [Deltaproteobacteria bacterium]MBW2083347.1 DUF72 domain-containing protein [Deltaproteobacteria bacterium]HDM09079.1 DUF72 domain-containing protein [Desulfobacteraceae bacterium]